MKRRSKPISKSSAIILLVLGLLLGTVFTFGEHYWHAPVDKRELRYIDAAYQNYKYKTGTHHSSMTLYFADEEVYDVSVECVDDDLLHRLDEIKPGAVLHLGVHPNSSTLMEITDHGRTVLSFEQASERGAFRTRGFLLLGLFMYACALYAAITLLRGKIR